MNLTEGFLRDELFIDFSMGMSYGEDQIYLDYPCRFATVSFQLMATSGLERIADRIRKDLGFKPIHPMDEYTDGMCDLEGWYEFSVGLNGWSTSHVDSCIEFVLVNSQSPDNEECYTIDLDGNEQGFVFTRLDEQCRKYFGQGCLELLEESKKEMEAVM